MFLDFYSYQNIVLLFARIVLGLTFVKHGWPKIKQPLGMKEWLAQMRFPKPGILSVAVAIIEFFGGILIIIGLLTQTSSFLLTIVMVITIWINKFKLKKTWVGGYELNLALMALALILIIFGPGDWALDY